MDGDFQKFVQRIYEGILKEDFSLSNQLEETSDTSNQGELILNEVVAAVVLNFKDLTLENTKLLIRYSMQLDSVESSCYLIDALMKEFEACSMLDSEMALHLWAHARFVQKMEASWDQVLPDSQKLCTDVLSKLNKYKFRYLQHYQKYVEDKDRQKIKLLHEGNRHLQAIVCCFVTYYFSECDLTTVQKLLSAAKAISCCTVVKFIFKQLHFEMQKYKQLNTFEAFCLFNELKNYMALESFESLQAEEKSSFERLKAKAPTCLHLLLWPEGNENQLRLVNKFFGASLSVQQDRIVCINSEKDRDDELNCSATLDPVEALINFSFKSGHTTLNLDATAEGTAKVAEHGTKWRLKAVDDHYVKIYTDNGKKNL